MPDDENSAGPAAPNFNPESVDEPVQAPKCMSCRAVALVTPLGISAFLINSHYKWETVMTYKVAKIPGFTFKDGRPTWRLRMHRYNMLFTAPICE